MQQHAERSQEARAEARMDDERPQELPQLLQGGCERKHGESIGGLVPKKKGKAESGECASFPKKAG
jgi:hypothetical protein